MKLQIITMEKSKFKNIQQDVVFSTLSEFESLDSFDFNIIDLNCEQIWRNYENNPTTVGCINDFQHIKTALLSSQSSINIILFPQNVKFQYNYCSTTGRYYNFIELKNNLCNLTELIISKLIPAFINIRIYYLGYENTKTILDGEPCKASFYFLNISNIEILSTSVGSKKATTIKHNNRFILSTLDISNNLIDFLRSTKLIQDRPPYPEWLLSINFYDDIEQQQSIDNEREIITNAEQKIQQSENALSENLKYKSILVSNGDYLVEVVFEILSEILSYDLSNFKDSKIEDLLIELDSITFVGEIKGINSNVKSEHISQAERHLSAYRDKLQENEIEKNAKCILIINPCKDKPVNDREPIHNNQIDLAKKRECLIIETKILLKLFEKFLRNAISTETIIDILSSKTGLLNETDF